MNTEAALTRDPQLLGAFAYGKAGKKNFNKILAKKYNLSNISDDGKQITCCSGLLTNLVPWVSFDLWKLKFIVIWIHAFDFFSSGCTQNLKT